MDAVLLSGILAGWAATQIVLGVYLVLAGSMERREVEYLLFGLSCFALAMTSAGAAWIYFGGKASWTHGMMLLHVGAIAASALNLHFAMCYSGMRPSRRLLAGLYSLAAIFELFNVSGRWWVPGVWHRRHTRLLGFEWSGYTQRPTALALTFYALAAVAVAAGLVLLYRAYRSGRKEALPALLGGLVVLPAMGNDVAIVWRELGSICLVPHAFWFYALPVAGTLLARYRAAAGELELKETVLRLKTEQLQQSTEQLRQVHDELARKQQLAAVGELAAAIAHEVRNPLAIIINAVAGLRRATVTEHDRATLLDIVEEESARLNGLVTDLLQYARPVKLTRSNFSPAELVRRAQARADERHAVVGQTDSNGGVTSLRADAELLGLALDNVVSNSIQSMPNGGTIRIVVVEGQLNGAACARIEVRDTGCGMDEKVLSRAMDPFFTTHPSGTGLGLSIVQRIMEAHGGAVELASQPGEGTLVTLLLPLGDPQTAGTTANAEAGP
jgi:signal transduction histidine kinase